MFQPVIPSSGFAGWKFLQQTYDSQFETFTASTELKRDTDYFREKVGEIQNAEELVADRRLLSVALGAFGLQDDIDNKFFIQKILQEGTTDPSSFANNFSDSRYSELSEAFGFGPGEVRNNVFSFFPDEIIDLYERQRFEIAVGTQSEDLRIALGAERELGKLAESENSEIGKWFEIMGNPPMRQLFETALSLPDSFGQIDIDLQQKTLAEKSNDIFGTSDPADFADPELQEKLVSRYTAISQITEYSAATSSLNIAMILLSS